MPIQRQSGYLLQRREADMTSTPSREHALPTVPLCAHSFLEVRHKFTISCFSVILFNLVEVKSPFLHLLPDLWNSGLPFQGRTRPETTYGGGTYSFPVYIHCCVLIFACESKAMSLYRTQSDVVWSNKLPSHWSRTGSKIFLCRI